MSTSMEETISSLKCGCTISKDKEMGYLRVKYCAAHGAAPELLAACEAALESLMDPNRGQAVTLRLLRTAIAKATWSEGRKQETTPRRPG